MTQAGETICVHGSNRPLECRQCHAAIDKNAITFIVNGIPQAIARPSGEEWQDVTITYADVVSRAGYAIDRVLTVIFSAQILVGRISAKYEGSLVPGQSCLLPDGMRFTVADTSNA